MTFSKRLMDIVLATLLAAILIPVFIGIAIWVLIKDGRPILFKSDRMKTNQQRFRLWKFRTMTVSDNDKGVSGRDKASRITNTGATLRALRLDELPQLYNVIRGDISFVGPRPPLPEYVEAFPDLYAEVLKSRPGITGLATLVFHKHEETLLAQCLTPEETDRTYRKRCVPRKAKLDLIYQRKRTACYDLKLMIATVFRKISLH